MSRIRFVEESPSKDSSTGADSDAQSRRRGPISGRWVSHSRTTEGVEFLQARNSVSLKTLRLPSGQLKAGQVPRRRLCARAIKRNSYLVCQEATQRSTTPDCSHELTNSKPSTTTASTAQSTKEPSFRIDRGNLIAQSSSIATPKQEHQKS